MNLTNYWWAGCLLLCLSVTSSVLAELPVNRDLAPGKESDNLYVRNTGLLPAAKATADAKRMVELIKAFEQKHLDGRCMKSYERQGLSRLLQLKDEEGRDSDPPRSGYETELYLRLKKAFAAGEKLDQERLLQLALESSIDKNGDVNLQDVFLTLHNVTRLLARPETWWVDHWYVSGIVAPDLVGGGEITRGKWVPGWRGLYDDPIFPIVLDIFGQKPVEGHGGKTLAELMEVREDDPDRIDKLRTRRAQKLEEKKRLLKGLKEKLEKIEKDAADRAARLQSYADSQRHAYPPPIEQTLSDLQEEAAEKMLLEQRIGYLIKEINEPDLSENILNVKYTADLFDLPDQYGEGGGLFKPLYGARDGLGNGGNYYYFWLGALAQSSVGIGAVKGAVQYESAQKWLGTEQEYARGLVQVSHFEAGGKLGGAAHEYSADCRDRKARGPVAGGTLQLPFEPPLVEAGYVTSRHNQRDWYCTNRPIIEAPVALPPILTRGSVLSPPGAFEDAPIALPPNQEPR